MVLMSDARPPMQRAMIMFPEHSDPVPAVVMGPQGRGRVVYMAAGFDAANFSVQGLYAAQILLGALGVLTITGEYATGMIRTTLTSVPQRRSMLLLKGAVFVAAALVLGEIASFGAFGVGQAILRGKGAGVSLTDHNVLRVVIGGGLYIAVVGLLAFGLGAAFGVLAMVPSWWRHRRAAQRIDPPAATPATPTEVPAAPYAAHQDGV